MSIDVDPENDEKSATASRRTQTKKKTIVKNSSPTASPHSGSVQEPVDDSPTSPSPTHSPTKNMSPLQKRLKQIAKAQRPLHLWSILWVLAYPALVRKDAEDRVAERKSKVEQGSLKKTQEQKNQIMDFIFKNCMPQLQEIYKLKKALVIVNEPKEKAVGEKDRQKNFTQLIVGESFYSGLMIKGKIDSSYIDLERSDNFADFSKECYYVL